MKYLLKIAFERRNIKHIVFWSFLCFPLAMVSQQKPRDWLAIRNQYETTLISQRKLARAVGVPISTLMQRAMREKWIQRARLVSKASADIESKLNAKVKAKIESELAPWIEAEKVKFTKAGHDLAIKGVSRVKRYFRSNSKVEAKSESMIAKAASDYHRIGRIALGMGDGSPAVGNVNLNILTNQAAIAVAPTDSPK